MIACPDGAYRVQGEPLVSGATTPRTDSVLLKTVSRGTYSMQLVLQGFPKSLLSGDGTGTLSGELSMQLVRL